LSRQPHEPRAGEQAGRLVSTALLIGATGLVGSHLLRRLLGDARFSAVGSFGRRPRGASPPKPQEEVADLPAPATRAGRVKGDVAFSALGTTVRQAGGQAAQRRVDYDYQLEFARAAAKGGVATYVLCSASSANPDARVFYSRLKGELDRDVQQLGFA